MCSKCKRQQLAAARKAVKSVCEHDFRRYLMPHSPKGAPMARPSKFTEKLAAQICEKLADGQSLRSICSADNMPAKSTVFQWLASNPAFADQYARAREAQADALFDEILVIADDSRGDSYVDDEGVERTNHEVVARSKLMVEARKWMAGKLRPKVYGDKVTQEHTGRLMIASDLTDEQLAAIATTGGR